MLDRPSARAAATAASSARSSSSRRSSCSSSRSAWSPTAVFYFGDILLTFFLAWLLAFIISPIVTRIAAAIPRLPRALATVLVYTAHRGRAHRPDPRRRPRRSSNSISQFVASLPDIRANIDEIVAPMQALARLDRPRQVDLAAQAQVVLDNLDDIAGQLIVPLQSIAVASVGAIGTMLIVFFLSLYMVVDRDQILAFLFRLVPPSYAEEARLLQTSVARSFGGFLRGQALMGVVYFGVAARDQPRSSACRYGADRRSPPAS